MGARGEMAVGRSESEVTDKISTFETMEAFYVSPN